MFEQRKESRVKIAERRARIAVLEEERFKPIVAEWPHDCDGVEWSGPQAQAARAHEMAVREERRERESAEREARKALEKPVKRQRGEGAAGGRLLDARGEPALHRGDRALAGRTVKIART